MKKVIFALSLIAATASASYATTYEVYSQPNKGSQVVSAINDQNSNQYMPFYQKGHWVKVADTATGNTGWINIQPTSAKQQANYQKKLNAINSEYQQLQAQRQIFEQTYQAAVNQLQYKAQLIENQMNQAQNANSNPQATEQTEVVQQSFNSFNVQVNKDGKTATVTREWLGKDGKMHKQTKQVPVSELQSVAIGV
ncbi:MAG: hypothetical protein EP298_13220 [Gammaproteobacteria bacterium]|nr:MAG: hypothetical protein EP298_13220 [Gammaproteobacteria bacterium]UTW41761.1 hypothetical protein KFE69_09615 [bacterium SCSIO 12844]